jgi:DNA-binding NtrC family response regulator
VSHAILICDDDPEIRGAMKRTLRGFNVTEVSSPREALAMMKTRAFDAIVCDFSLEADSDGLDVLQHVRVQYPDTIRFLVTGNQDIEVAARAVNEGAVHRYFSKPWNDDKLRSALEIVLRIRAPR